MAAHIAKSPAETLLPHFYGAFSVYCPGANFRISLVIMANAFPVGCHVSEKYDLKGSSLGRFVSPDEAAAGCSTFKDLNFNLDGLDANCRTYRTVNTLVSQNIAVPGNADKRITICDEATRTRFLAALERDVAWLASQSLIDYSLLLGFVDKEVHPPSISEDAEAAAAEDEGAETTAAGGNKAAAESSRPTFRNISSKQRFQRAVRKVTYLDIATHHSLDVHTNDSHTAMMMSHVSRHLDDNHVAHFETESEFSVLHSTADGKSPVTAVLGLIDILTCYDGKKVAEHHLKATVEAVRFCRWCSRAMSCVPPPVYAGRMLRFITANTVANISSSSTTSSNLEQETDL